MSVVTVESLLKHCDLSESDLKSVIERENFQEISGSLTKWKKLALKLQGFNQGVVDVIEADNHNEEDKRLGFLERLKQKLSFNATYGLLVRTLLEIERADDAQSLCCHLKKLIDSRKDQGVGSALQLEILKKKDENIQQKFKEVVQAVQKSFSEREVNLSEILSSLQFIQCPEEKQIIKPEYEDLSKIQSLHMLFFSLSFIWDYIHPGLLEFIVESFGTNTDKSRVKEYMVALEKYRESVKLGEFVKIISKRPNPRFNKQLSVIVGEDWRNKTLQDLEDVRLQFAETSKCDRLLLRALPKQSHFTIVFSMPSWVQLNLVEMYPVLSTIGATKVYLNNDYIHECVPLKKEAADSSKMEKLQSLQCDISKERMCRFLYISDSDFEDLIKNISSDLKEKDLKAILALKWDYCYFNNPRDVLLHTFQKGQIMKFAPSTFQSVLKRIERMDLIPIIDDFYKYYNKPKVISNDTVYHHFESLHILLKSIRYSLWDLESDYKIAALTSLSSELENICYQAYNTYESIQNAVLEFTEMQSMKEEVLMKLQKLEVEATGKIQPHRLTELRTELSSIKEHQRRRERITTRNDSINDYFCWWDGKRTRMNAMLRKQERKIKALLGEPEERVMEKVMELDFHQLQFKPSEPPSSYPYRHEYSGKLPGKDPAKSTETSGKGDTPLKDTPHEDVY